MTADVPDLCQQCRERPAKGRMRWYGKLAWLLTSPPDAFDALCDDCAGGREFIGLSLVGAAGVVAVILAMIVL